MSNLFPFQFKLATKDNNANAQYWLAEYYENQLSKQNSILIAKQAYGWMSNAANNNHQDAQFNLARSKSL
jgi:TPR repeat protein